MAKPILVVNTPQENYSKDLEKRISKGVNNEYHVLLLIGKAGTDVSFYTLNAEQLTAMDLKELKSELHKINEETKAKYKLEPTPKNEVN